MARGQFGPVGYGFYPAKIRVLDAGGARVPTYSASGAEAPPVIDSQQRVSFWADAGTYTLELTHPETGAVDTHSITVTAAVPGPAPITTVQGETARATAAETSEASTRASADTAESTARAAETTRAEAAEALDFIPVYTRATRPAATGSGQTIYVSDDGAGVLLKDTAANTWTVLAPGEIAYASNVTGTVTTSSNGQVTDVPGCAVSVPASTRSVWLRAKITVQQSAVGTGNASIYLYETTSGSAVLLTNFLIPLPNMTTGGKYVDVVGEYRLGIVAATRTFKISVVTIVTTLTPAIQALNTVANPSELLAFTR